MAGSKFGCAKNFSRQVPGLGNGKFRSYRSEKNAINIAIGELIAADVLENMQFARFLQAWWQDVFDPYHKAQDCYYFYASLGLQNGLL